MVLGNDQAQERFLVLASSPEPSSNRREKAHVSSRFNVVAKTGG